MVEMRIPDTSLVILGGGLSRRFGENKVFARFQGVAFYQMILNNLRTLFSSSYLVLKNSLNQLENEPGLQQIFDSNPLQAPICGFLEALRQVESDYIFLLSVDMPKMDEKLPIWLRGEIQNDDLALIPEFFEQGPQPLCALYHRKILKIVERRFGEGEYSLKGLLNEDGVESKLFPGDTSFYQNLNTQEDLLRLEDFYKV